MLFNSADFLLVFFPLVTALYFLLPMRWRWLLLLVASCWFYMAFVPVYILILAFTVLIDFGVGLGFERCSSRYRKWLLVGSVSANVAVLGFFKYFNFLNTTIADILSPLGIGYSVPGLEIILPIGLSFHTFQSLSYIIEVYRGHQKPERHPGMYALYVMFYPQLVAGPIERPANLLHRLHHLLPWNGERVVNGLKQMLWGFFKKVVIADRCAVIVDQVYDAPETHGSLSIILATYFFAIQIYCDFSGYTDIALGAAHLMGFDLMVNFRTPYRSASISEFWSRWHISLSTWFRDYVYIPLGGSRCGRSRTYMNLLLVFLLSGFWHGANWTFVMWGALHGAFLILSLASATLLRPLGTWLDQVASVAKARWIHVILTFHLVCLGWVFFRAANIGDAFVLLKRIATTQVSGTDVALLMRSIPEGMLVTTLALVIVFLFIDKPIDAWMKRERPGPTGPWGTLVQAMLLVSVILFGHFGETNFIYFQF